MSSGVVIMGFRASDTGILIYLKKDEECRQYLVKEMRNGEKKTWSCTSSLSIALHEMANLVAIYTNGFTTWDEFK